MKFIFLIFALKLPFSLLASCIDESKDYEGCTRCCSVTVQVVQLTDEFPAFKSDIRAGCIDSSKSATREAIAYKGLYEKYKIDSSTFYYLCNEPRILDQKTAYGICNDECNKKWPKKK